MEMADLDLEKLIKDQIKKKSISDKSKYKMLEQIV